MKIATGNVVKGATIIDNPEFKEGTEVFILTREREEEVRLSPEELAELGAGIAEADICHRIEFLSRHFRFLVLFGGAEELSLEKDFQSQSLAGISAGVGI